jgi:hypothetical protein
VFAIHSAIISISDTICKGNFYATTAPSNRNNHSFVFNPSPPP